MLPLHRNQSQTKTRKVMKHNGKILEVKYENHTLYLIDEKGSKVAKLETVASSIPPHKLTDLLVAICKQVNG